MQGGDSVQWKVLFLVVQDFYGNAAKNKIMVSIRIHKFLSFVHGSSLLHNSKLPKRLKL